MGMSSSQARLLTLTARMHQIEYKAAKLEAMKLQMANESTRVYEDYLNALDATKLQRKAINNDGSVTFVDTTYNDLCFGSADKRFSLISVDSGKPIIPQTIATKYENNKFDPAAFATDMTGYVPSVIPEYGSSGIYTPPSNADEVAENTDITMSMGDAKRTTITSEGITLTLGDGLGSSNNTYTITSKDGDNHEVTFQYLKNGRLVICGEGLEITANGSQNDDIILLGDGNIVNTGAGDDIVRVGITLGQDSFRGNGNNNVINTGSGTDHVVLGAIGNEVSDAENILYMSSYIKTSSTVSSGNQWVWYQSSNANANVTSQATNTLEGFASQGSVGDCRLFSLINSLGAKNNGDLSEYVSITKSNSDYVVTFNNYPGAVNAATITEDEVKKTQNVTGDLTTILIDLAINKLMVQNDDDIYLSSSVTNVGNAFERAMYNTVSKYFFGNTKVELANSYEDFEQQWAKYSNPSNTEYSNLLVGFKTSNASLGIVGAHAYSVKNVTSEYVELVNPWDDGDILRLSIDDFKLYFRNSFVFGTGSEAPISNVENSVMSENEQIITHYAQGGNSAADAEWNYFYNLHQKITSAGGYEIVEAENTGNPNYLINVISGGYAYLVQYDNNKKEFVDTSVATNTLLQEVPNEILLKKAEAKYESDMKRIDVKDRKYDMDLAALDNERNAIKQEIETLKTVSKENVERTFKLFS